ncbi:MAG: hypothetical protein KGL39_12770 [Patescibacteria group bacterium]|nr:hypothetical protein [Patescibacteria group bacterium]
MPRTDWVWGDWQNGTAHDYDAPYWAYDIETNGRELDDPALKILLLGIYDGKTCIIYGPKDLSLGVSRMQEAARRGVRLVGHNAIGFDAEYLFRFYSVFDYLRSDDTMILAHVINEEGPLGLEPLACQYLSVPPWKEQVTWDWTQIGDEQIKAAADYNAEDTIHTWHLAGRLFDEAKAQGLERTYDIMRKGTEVFEHHIARNGIALDVPTLRTLKDSLLVESLDAALKFERVVGHTVNIGSPKQVGKALFETLGLRPAKYTKTGAPSTDEESLKELMLNRAWAPGEPARDGLDALLRARKSGKLASMLEAYETKSEQLDDHWRIYPRYFTWKTTTHRSTADKGFQQWPHDPRVRGLLTARPGHALLAADYSQLQMRIAAQISGSPQMRRLFTDDIDPHTFMAAKITGKAMADVTKQERYVAKPVNFALLFGAEPFTLRVQALKDYNLVLSNEQAQMYHDIFHEAYGLEAWYARVATELKKTGAIRSPLGAIRHLPNIHSGDHRLRNEALRQAINAPVQDLEVMIAYLAMWTAYSEGLRLVAFLHDALYVEAPEAEAVEQGERLRAIMETEVPRLLAERYDYRLDVPLGVEIEMSPCYNAVK